MSETYDLYQQGRAHLSKGRAAQATVALEKAKRREPRKASIREALGIAYLRIQRYEEAEQEFRVMLELSPADHYAHYALGRALGEAGEGRRGERPLQARQLVAARRTSTTPRGSWISASRARRGRRE
jgi:tetratricopeptide (TPR) repeat protein